MMAKITWELGSIIYIILGIVHLVYTLFTNKFSSKNKTVMYEMKSSYPILTSETSIWKAWVGFNASHSIGLVFIGITNIYLAERFFLVLREPFFLCLNIITIIFYLWLAKKYWFKSPVVGFSVILICYVTTFIIINYNTL